MQTYTHPISRVPINGTRLAPGAVLQEIDKYNSTDGEWRACPVAVGTVPHGNHVIWVRPRDLSEEGKDLLRFLTAHPGELYSYIARRDYGYVVVPTQNWRLSTAAMNLATPSVKHRECVQELADFGLLSFDPIAEVYSVTASGREEVKQF